MDECIGCKHYDINWRRCNVYGDQYYWIECNGHDHEAFEIDKDYEEIVEEE